MNTRKTAVAVLSAVALSAPLLVAGGGPAAARPAEKVSYSDTFDEPFTFCPGLDAWISGEVSGWYLVNSRGKDGIVHGSDHQRVQAVWTNLDTGKTFTLASRVNSNDLKVVDNGDDTVTVTALSTGNETWYGPDGKAVLRNPGQVRFLVVIDTNGTPWDFEDDTVVADLGLIKGSTGRNDTEGRDFCTDLALFTS